MAQDDPQTFESPNFGPKAFDLEALDWSKGDGFLPAVIQDAATLQVLMLGYVNREALAETIATGLMTFWSRSKGRLWRKGETSGNCLEIVSITPDCDRDALLVLARPRGPVCHLNTTSCFGAADAPGLGFLARLEDTIRERRNAAPEESYTARLFAGGARRIAQKIGEEGVETALALAAQDDGALLDEAADLLYHLAIGLAARGKSLADVAERLRARSK
ncbi:MAG: bifunctional phosphoribosyl-AMP cyclohydrolase/phosphoribosyl-ATP diphosphatase HisIE [Parvularculaceae bacterium]